MCIRDKDINGKIDYNENYKFIKEWLSHSITGMDKYCTWLEKKIKID